MEDNDDLFDINADTGVKPRRLLEKDIESKVCAYAKRRGWRSMKFTSPNYRSVPDRIFFKFPACVFLIEFKQPGKKPTTKQAEEIKRFTEEGFSVYVVDDISEGFKVIDAETSGVKTK